MALRLAAAWKLRTPFQCVRLSATIWSHEYTLGSDLTNQCAIASPARCVSIGRYYRIAEFGAEGTLEQPGDRGVDVGAQVEHGVDRGRDRHLDAEGLGQRDQRLGAVDAF